MTGVELEIVNVTVDPGEGVRSHFRALSGDGRRVQIIGWVLGQSAPATEVEVIADGSVAARTSVALDRPDVAEAFPDVLEAATAGFHLELLAQGKGESRLEVLAVLRDDVREPLGRIVVRAARRGFLDVLRRG